MKILHWKAGSKKGYQWSTAMRAKAITVAALLTLLSQSVAAECLILLPPKGLPVYEYIRLIGNQPQSTVSRQVGDALKELVEYTPMNCADTEPDDSYSHFIIRNSTHDNSSCQWLTLRIAPPDSAQTRPDSQVRCEPAKPSVGDWTCRFTFQP
jgi:hypothetical protein